MKDSSFFHKQSFWVLLLGLALYLLYASPIHTEYLFADETFKLLAPTQSDLGQHLFNRALKIGRPISSSCYVVISWISSSGPTGLLLLRILQFLASWATAAYFFSFLRRKELTDYWAFFLVLLIWSQPVLQVFHVYSSLTPFLVGVCVSCFAFSRAEKRTLRTRSNSATLFLYLCALLMISWLTHPATAFCGLALLAWYALNTPKDLWHRVYRKYIFYLLAVTVTMVVYSVSYKVFVLLAGDGTKLHSGTDRVFGMASQLSFSYVLDLLSLSNYTGPFEWWNYFFPINALSDETFAILAFTSMAIWVIVLASAFLREKKQDGRRYAVQKYGLIMIALTLTFLPLIADNFSFRQHLYVACVPALILIFAYSLRVCVRTLSKKGEAAPALTYIGIFVGLWIMLGAQAQVSRALVLPSERFCVFLKTEIDRQSHKRYDRILIVNAPQICRQEPCRGYMSRRMSVASRTGPKWFKRLLRWSGATKGAPMVFAEEVARGIDRQQTLIIDCRKLRRSIRLSAVQ